MLTNIDLENLAKVYDVKINGIYSKDKIPKKLNKGWYIINMQNSTDGNGTHWETFLYHDNKPSVYIDSYGIKPSLEIIEAMNNNYLYNNKQIQALTNDDNCGSYCLSAICFWKGKDKLDDSKVLSQYQHLWSDKTNINKNLLKDFLYKYYNTNVQT